jgi:acyl-CoA reductase-like NAD-dependent aldehyde dehydrogenase
MAYETISPANGAPVEKFVELSDVQLENSVARAQRAYREEWRDWPVTNGQASFQRPRRCSAKTPTSTRA